MPIPKGRIPARSVSDKSPYRPSDTDINQEKYFSGSIETPPQPPPPSELHWRKLLYRGKHSAFPTYAGKLKYPTRFYLSLSNPQNPLPGPKVFIFKFSSPYSLSSRSSSFLNLLFTVSKFRKAQQTRNAFLNFKKENLLKTLGHIFRWCVLEGDRGKKRFDVDVSTEVSRLLEAASPRPHGDVKRQYRARCRILHLTY